MHTFVLFFYIIVCFALTIVILLQSSKGGGLAGAFGGGGGMGAVFGGRGAATFLSRVTTVLATAFMLIALALSFLNEGSVGAKKGLVEQQTEKASSLPGTGLPVVPTGDDQELLPIQPAPTTTDSTKK
jgi:preprotein translocase subunit SecG